MEIKLKNSWEIEIFKISYKIYLINDKSQGKINKVFNKLYKYNKILQNKKASLFNFLIFIIYKDIYIKLKHEKI